MSNEEFGVHDTQVFVNPTAYLALKRAPYKTHGSWKLFFGTDPFGGRLSLGGLSIHQLRQLAAAAEQEVQDYDLHHEPARPITEVEAEGLLGDRSHTNGDLACPCGGQVANCRVCDGTGCYPADARIERCQCLDSPCEACRGGGYVFAARSNGEPDEACIDCGGSGRRHYLNDMATAVPCHVCNGSGKTPPRCNGEAQEMARAAGVAENRHECAEDLAAGDHQVVVERDEKGLVHYHPETS